MAPMPATPRRPPTGRRRGRPRGSTNAARAAAAASEPPPKRRRYIPGGPGGGGRFIDDDGVVAPADASGPASAPRPRAAASQSLTTVTPSVYPRRERSTRTRTAANHDDADDMQFSSAAAVAAAVVQSDGYKPREERGWEEFHPNLDIEATFMIFHSEDVDGTVKTAPPTPAVIGHGTPANGASTPLKDVQPPGTSATETPGAIVVSPLPASTGLQSATPPRRRVGRPPRDPFAYLGIRGIDFASTPKTPKPLPIHNQTPKEKLDLKLPSYRKTDRIELFESSQARYVEKSMMNVGYQESDNYIRPERSLIKANDANGDDDFDQSALSKAEAEPIQHSAGVVGRVEYDMDEQDDMWLANLNAQRKVAELEPITREIFEITITKIEKEWHALEKRIPKPNPKPPQTHRPRSSSAAAVNGEPQVGEEQDSKCAICDDGDCENTNAIVFCDGCDLAVHQECYGVPFIPEGQWLCRKCQLIGRGIPTCIFCPNTDGAFKQTNSSKWAHLLCAMWIPEVSLGNHTFMEPVMDVEKVPKNRWRLTCYICNQRMGACIQCGNKVCYQAFHVTCARRARLYLKMKNSQGALAVLDGSMILKAFCDKHCPQDYAKENSVSLATREAKRFYRRTMKGRIWADSPASALAIAATHRHAITEHPPDESQMTGAKLEAAMGENKKGQPSKPPWKLPTGAPVIPQAVYELVESALQRFPVRKRKDFIGEACRYWTLKREARRGAALLKRLQLQMETFSSMELTRRNFAAMGPSGKARLTRRVEFAKTLLNDLEQLKNLSEDVVKREQDKLEQAEIEQDMVDTCYFPVYRLLQPVLEKAFSYDNKNVFQDGLTKVQAKLDERFYTTTLAFTHDLCEAIHVGINTEPKPTSASQARADALQASPSKQASAADAGFRKRLGKRIFQYVKPTLLEALQVECDITHKPFDNLVKELEGMIDASLELRQPSITVSQADAAERSGDVIMVGAGDVAGQIVVRDPGDVDAESEEDGDEEVAGDEMDVDDDRHGHVKSGGVKVKTSPLKMAVKVNGVVSSSTSVAGDGDLEPQSERHMANGIKASGSPPSTNGFMPPANVNPAQGGPLTPPQSNGSLGRGPTDILNEGGLPWYLNGFGLEGTTAVDEPWSGRDAVRCLSEELTDMDDEELKGLAFEVDGDNVATPSADIVGTGDVAAASLSSPAQKRNALKRAGRVVRSSTRRR